EKTDTKQPRVAFTIFLLEGRIRTCYYRNSPFSIQNAMQNNERSQSKQYRLPRRSQTRSVQRARSAVGQDNPTPPPARTATAQPAPPKIGMRPTPKKTNTARTQQGKALRRKTVHLTLWVRPVVKAELQRIAQ